jgi:hypothetical protein
MEVVMRLSSSVKPFVAVLAVVMGAVNTVAAEPLSATFDRDGVTIHEGQMPVLRYQGSVTSYEGGWPRSGYVHPLYDTRGEVITEDFPEDHRHHRGVFWAWHQVWVGDQLIGDPWVCKDFVWDVQSISSSRTADAISVLAVVHWKSPQLTNDTGVPVPIVDERSRMRVHAMQTDERGAKFRVVDFQLSFRAMVDGVRIGGSDDEKGYGGFSPRIRLTGQETFRSDGMELDPGINAITAGLSVNISRPDSGLVMIVHRDNPMAQSGRAAWILRRSRSMQNPVYPGREPVSISRDDPLVLRYRLVMHDGNLSDETIDRLQAEF